MSDPNSNGGIEIPADLEQVVIRDNVIVDSSFTLSPLRVSRDADIPSTQDPIYPGIRIGKSFVYEKKVIIDGRPATLRSNSDHVLFDAGTVRPRVRKGATVVVESGRPSDEAIRSEVSYTRAPVASPASADATAEVVAAALYDILDRNQASFVAGDPRDGGQTTIDGRWDLVEVARQLLRQVDWP